jgi:hypothetical protein
MSQTIAVWDTVVLDGSRFEVAANQNAEMELGDLIAEHTFRVEAVDTSHPAWDEVFDAIARAGDGPALMLNDSGRLSSRQTVVAAFTGEQVVGHLCFQIEATRSPVGGVQLRTRLDSFAVEADFAGTIVETLLADTADERARLMKCRGPRITALVVC